MLLDIQNILNASNAMKIILISIIKHVKTKTSFKEQRKYFIKKDPGKANENLCPPPRFLRRRLPARTYLHESKEHTKKETKNEYRKKQLIKARKKKEQTRHTRHRSVFDYSIFL